MHWIGRILLIAALLLAPWPFGSVTPEYQWLLCITLSALLLWRLVETIVNKRDHAFDVPLAVIAPAGLLLLASVQLLPREQSPLLEMEHAVFAEWTDAFSAEGPARGSVSPATTRTQASRMFFALAAFLLAAQWFSTAQSQIWLWRALALNGAALGFFAIVQRVTWNGLLFWAVPLRLGGTPYASYVNRNNAAGYLNLCLAAGLGWFFYQYVDRITRARSQDWRGRSRLPWKARVLKSIAGIDGGELALLGLLALLAAAVLFSLSRGGILAMVIGLGVTLWWHGRLPRNAAVLGVLMLGIGASGLVLWVGGWDAVQQRLSSLSDPTSAAEGRFVHWWDTSGSVSDFPLLGTGLGTYRYANLPYQRHQGHVWYVNADNHYFEMLVETGFFGLALFIGGFVLTGMAARFLVHSERPELRAVGIMGVFAVVSQAVHAVTDFGLLIPANALTFAVLAGSVCGAACRSAAFERIRLPVWLSAVRLEGRPGLVALNLTLTLVSAAFAWEMFALSRTAAAGRVIVAIDPVRLQETRDEMLIAAIEDAERALRYRPDDPELHRTIADWWISRYRLGAARQLRKSPELPGRFRGRRLWKATSLGALNARILELTQTGNRQQADDIRALPLVQNHLVPARAHLLAASRCGPLTRAVSEDLANLAFLAQGEGDGEWPADMARYAKQALFIAPSSPDDLLATAILADSAGFRSLADRAYCRCLRISDKHLMSIWKMTYPSRPLAEVVASVIPRHVDRLVSLAEQVPQDDVKETLALRAEQALQQDNWEDAEEPSYRLQARLAELRGNTDQAIRLHRMALSDDPWSQEDIETRWRIAKLLMQDGQLTEAETELSLLRRLAPNRSDIREQFEALRLRDLERHPGQSNASAPEKR